MKFSLTIIFRITLMLLLYIITKISIATDLYFAGFAFIGNADQKNRYPVASEIFLKNKTLLSSRVKEALQLIKRNDLNIIYDEGTIGSGNAVALAFGLMDENVERIVNKLGVTSHYKIFGQVLIFDYIENKVLSNFPVLSRYTVITEKIPTKKYDFEVIKSLYLDLNREASIFSQWVRMLEKINLDINQNKLYLGVENIFFEEGVKKQLPDRLIKNDILKTRTAQKVEYNIAYQYGIPLVPYTIGVAIGGKGEIGLMTRFTDSVSKELKLPDLDYAINITIRKFRKKKLENDFYENLIYAAFIKFDFIELYESNTIISERFYWAEDITFAKTLDYKVVDEWQIYETVQANLINKTIKILLDHDEKEVGKITKKEFKQLYPGLAKVKKIINKLN